MLSNETFVKKHTNKQKTTNLNVVSDNVDTILNSIMKLTIFMSLHFESYSCMALHMIFVKSKMSK
jgi:hypothetical protein